MNEAAQTLGRLSVQSRRKKLGKKAFNENMRELAKKKRKTRTLTKSVRRDIAV